MYQNNLIYEHSSNEGTSGQYYLYNIQTLSLFIIGNAETVINYLNAATLSYFSI